MATALFLKSSSYLIRVANSLLIIALFIYYYQSGELFSFLTIAIFLTAVFVGYEKEIILFFSFVTLVFYPRYLVDFSFFDTNDILAQNDWFKQMSGFDYGLLKFSVATFFILIIYFLRKVRLRPFLFYFASFGIAIALVWVYRSSKNSSFQTATIAVLMASFLFRTSISFAYLKLRYDTSNWQINEFLVVAPFWQIDLPHWDQSRLDRKVKDHFSRQAKIFTQVLFTCSAFYFFDKFNTTVSQKYHISDYRYCVIEVISGQLPVWFGWAFLIYSCLSFIVYKLWVWPNLIILFLKSIGFEMELNFKNPLSARSFSEFFSRMFNYYSKVLVIVAYMPFLRLFSSKRFSKATRKFLALFVSIYSFTMFFHISKHYFLFLTHDPWRAVASYLIEFSFYSLLLATLISVSIFIPDRWPKFIPKFVIIIFYFITYSFVLFAATLGSTDLHTKFKFVGKILGLF